MRADINLYFVVNCVPVYSRITLILERLVDRAGILGGSIIILLSFQTGLRLAALRLSSISWDTLCYGFQKGINFINSIIFPVNEVEVAKENTHIKSFEFENPS